MAKKRVLSSDACPKTLQRRVHKIREVREMTSLEVEDEIRAMPREKRQELLIEALPLTIPTSHALAMKSILSISWSKLRTLRR